MTTELLVPLIVVAAGIAYIFLPFWGGATPLQASGQRGTLPRGSLAQLELDRDLGKIEQSEYDELRPRLEQLEAPTREEIDIEAIIAAARRGKRLDLAMEAEIAVARERLRKTRH